MPKWTLCIKILCTIPNIMFIMILVVSFRDCVFSRVNRDKVINFLNVFNPRLIPNIIAVLENTFDLP